MHEKYQTHLKKLEDVIAEGARFHKYFKIFDAAKKELSTHEFAALIMSKLIEEATQGNTAFLSYIEYLVATGDTAIKPQHI